MEIVRSAEQPWTVVSGHRTGSIEFKRLLTGVEGTPDNFELSLVRNRGRYYTPRHRHNFDQIRLCVSGKMNYAPRKDVRVGDVAYFPEGTPYGPQEVEGEPVTLVLQFGGGAGGSGFMSYRQLDQGYRELAKLGEFSEGIFRRAEGANLAPGVRRAQDSYEAIWEHVNGQPVTYPPPRYDEPVLMHAENFAWRAAPDAPGVASKPLGVFSERRIEMLFHRLDAGSAMTLRSSGARRLLFVVAGAGRVGEERFADHAAIGLEADEEPLLRAEAVSEIFVMGLPHFEPPANAAMGGRD